MSVFEQTQPVNIKEICLDVEYALKVCTPDGKEIFTIRNLPQDKLNALINTVKELVKAPFYIEYKTPTLNAQLFISNNGFCLEPYRFNTRYAKRVVLPKAAMVYRLGETAGAIISKHMKKQDKALRRFVQTCVLLEYVPNLWVSDDNVKLSLTSPLSEASSVEIQSLDIANETAIIPDRAKRLEIAGEIAKRFPSDDTEVKGELTEVQSHFFIDYHFSFNGKEYSNWYSAFIDHIAKYETFYSGKSRPTLSSHLKNQKELEDINSEIRKLEALNKEYRSIIACDYASAGHSNLSDTVKNNQAKLSHLRFKRREFNIRSDRQLNILEERFLLCHSSKSNGIKKAAHADIEKLLKVRAEALSFEELKFESHKKMSKMIKVPFKGYRIDGMMIIEGDIDFKMDTHFINKLYSQNISVFKGVVKLGLEMPDGKVIWHIPSYIESKQRRVDTKGLFIHFDQNVFEWMISQEQTRHNMIIQAVLNQHQKVMENSSDE